MYFLFYPNELCTPYAIYLRTDHCQVTDGNGNGWTRERFRTRYLHIVIRVKWIKNKKKTENKTRTKSKSKGMFTTMVGGGKRWLLKGDAWYRRRWWWGVTDTLQNSDLSYTRCIRRSGRECAHALLHATYPGRGGEDMREVRGYVHTCIERVRVWEHVHGIGIGDGISV